jgi:hypothetical protein
VYALGRATEIGQVHVGADRGVAARDVEPDADDGDLVMVRRDAADGHDVTNVPVRHQRRVDRALTNVLELNDGLLVVLSKDLHGVRNLPIRSSAPVAPASNGPGSCYVNRRRPTDGDLPCPPIAERG